MTVGLQFAILMVTIKNVYVQGQIRALHVWQDLPLKLSRDYIPAYRSRTSPKLAGTTYMQGQNPRL